MMGGENGSMEGNVSGKAWRKKKNGGGDLIVKKLMTIHISFLIN
jgi:hypothetical protein